MTEEVMQDDDGMHVPMTNDMNVPMTDDMQVPMSSNFTSLKQEALVKQQEEEEEERLDSYGFVDKAMAALRTENFVGSYLSSADAQKDLHYAEYHPQEDYDPFDDISGYEQYADSFTESYTPMATASIKKKIDKELEDKEVLESAGMLGAMGYTLMATVLDPVQIATMAVSGGMSAGLQGASIAGKVAAGVAFNAAETAVLEVGLQSTQSTRELTTSALNVGLGGLLGGAFTGVAIGVGKALRKETEAIVDNIPPNAVNRTYNPAVNQAAMEAGEFTEVGARLSDLAAKDLEASPIFKDAGSAGRKMDVGMSAGSTELAGSTRLQRAARRIVKGYKGTKALGRLSPGIRTLTSTLTNTRNASLMMVDNALQLTRNYEGDMVQALTKAMDTDGVKQLRLKRTDVGVHQEQMALDSEYAKAVQEALEKVKGKADDPFEPTRELNQRAMNLEAKQSVIKKTAGKTFYKDVRQEIVNETHKLLKASVSPRDAVLEATEKVLTAHKGLLDDNVDTGLIMDQITKTFDDAFENSKVTPVSIETMKNKMVDMYIARVKDVEDTSFKAWTAATGKKHSFGSRAVFNEKAFLLRTLTKESDVPLAMEARGLDITAEELVVLQKHLSETEEKVLKPMYKDIEDNLPELWERMTFEDGSLKDPNHLHRMYNIDAINQHPEAFNDLLTNHIQSGNTVGNLEKQVAVRDSLLDEQVATKSNLEMAERKLVELEERLETLEAKDKFDAFIFKTGDEYNVSKRAAEADIELHTNALDEIEVKLELAEKAAKPIPDDEVARIVGAMVQKIKKQGGRITSDELVSIKGIPSSLKKRKLNMHNEEFLKGAHLLEETSPNPIDFIHTNMNHSLIQTVEDLSLETSFAKRLGEMGDVKIVRKPTMDELMEGADTYVVEQRELVDIEDLYAYMETSRHEAIHEGTLTDTEISKIANQTTDDVRDMEVMYERLTGSRNAYADPSSFAARASKSVLTLNTMLYLGKVTLSSIPDAGRLVMRNGLMPTVKSIGALLADLPENGFGHMKAEQLNAFGIGVSTYQNKYAQMLSDTKGTFDMTKKWDSALAKSSNVYMQLTGITMWNDAMQTVASVSSISNAIGLGKDLHLGKKVNKLHLGQARALGLSDTDMVNIYKQWELHGDTKAGTHLANIDKWDDPVLADKFTNAVYKDTKQTIIEPGVGDKPSWHDSSVLTKHASQFQSFISASITRSMLSGMQTDGIRAITGIITMMTLAHVARLGKAYLSDPEGEYLDRMDDESIAESTLKSLDATGMVPLMAYYSTYAMPFTGYSATGSESSKYSQNRSVASMLGGPTLSTLENAARATTTLLHEGEPSNAMAAATKVIPFQNHFAFAGLFKQFREELKD